MKGKWIDGSVGRPGRYERSLYVGKDGPGKVMLRVAHANRDETDIKHTDLHLSNLQAVQLTFWLVNYLITGERE